MCPEKSCHIKQGLLSIKPSEGKVAIIRINNKEQIQHAKCAFELSGLRVLDISSDNQKSDDVVEFLQTSTITDFDIVLTTSLLDEAINIKNTNIESVHIFRKLHCDEIKQFVGRCRKSVPDVYLHLLNSDLNFSDVNIKSERTRVETLCDTALDFCEQLTNGSNDFTKPVKQINETVKFHQGFEPLYYKIQEGEPPCIDEVSILAKLYSLSMEVQFNTDCTLGQALVDLKCFNAIELLDSGIKETDAATNTLSTQASEIQIAARDAAIEECATEITTFENDEEKMSVDDVNSLAERYEQSGIKGDVANDWKMLCLILPVDQALDALKNDRKQAVWNFYNAIENRLELIPFFEAIKEDLKQRDKLELVGSKVINDYFLQAIRKQAKKHSQFKGFIRKLNISGISVENNNKFKITNTFLFKFIRDFTQSTENRSGGIQSFTIKGICPFGYDYNINSLRSSKNKPRIRKKAT